MSIDYGGCVTRSAGRLSEDEAFVLTRVSRFGSDGYPVHKLGNGWTWGPIRGIRGLPCPVKTKREAVRLFEMYLDGLRDVLAGREERK